MATLENLKYSLRRSAIQPAPTPPLSDEQYSAGFDILVRGSDWTYQRFIVPQLSALLASLLKARPSISVLEVGPGPTTVLGYLPPCIRSKVSRYAAFEPNHLFAERLEAWFHSTTPFRYLEQPPNISRSPFLANSNPEVEMATGVRTGFDAILFCHSLYGLQPKREFIKNALEILVKRPDAGLVVIFHRDKNLDLHGLLHHQTASFPPGFVAVADDDTSLDHFASFIAGFIAKDAETDGAVRRKWRGICRDLARRDETHPGNLLFSAPTIMAAFTQSAVPLLDLTARLPIGVNRVKNREARLSRPSAIVRPTEVSQVQGCVRWALNHGVALTVVGGGHSGHCLWPGAVAIDMGAFDQIHILDNAERINNKTVCGSFVVAGSGCRSGELVGKALEVGLTVPLGARPSVGAGMWLQGGIGHLARLHGLSCDAIVGAVLISLASGQILYVGHVPVQLRPPGAVNPDNESDILWAIKGAGTNFGIIISVTFEAYAAPTYSVRNWLIPVNDTDEAQRKLGAFDEAATGSLPKGISIDAYLYWDTMLHLGLTMFNTLTTGTNVTAATTTPIDTILGPADDCTVVDGVGLFETEMYMSKMHKGHGGGKTSSFKRCLFLKSIRASGVASILVAAITSRPTPLCYFHLLQGGGAVADVAGAATAFGCRDWDFACIITGVWPRDQDGTTVAQDAVQWVYDVARDLLPLSSGAYAADLGPDPRDASLAARAFGSNGPRLARLKQSLDPGNVLAYACPLPKVKPGPRLVILVTGNSCAGKDYCANIWASVFTTYHAVKARAVSISDATKREYAAETGANLDRLLWDREYKERHRPALTAYFQAQVEQRPRLPEEHFLTVVSKAVDTDVLFITGMRDEAPLAAMSHLAPGTKLLEVNVKANKETRQTRRGHQFGEDDGSDSREGSGDPGCSDSNSCPSFIFENETPGDTVIKSFCETYLLPFVHKELQRLASMVRSVPDFPRRGIQFRHVLNIAQEPGGLALCTSLLAKHFTGDWANINAVVSCEVGGIVYASALAARVDVPLVLIREGGKLPPPIISVVKSPSHISSSIGNKPGQTSIEMGRDVVSKDASVVVVDDVLATGKTACAVLRLLAEAGIGPENVQILVVAEFPIHRGRSRLRQHGYGRTKIHSLLVFEGV
ncbi:CAZyme family AA7 [Purpureocillium lilacinum]|uniref:CAZyme family AA7 n=1 Tax=Purpureocillium lilacinum TaxID=33203 RepID=A0ABR0BGR9_PURLI|nr:CAZyme family AA7 [Purpureocillium lilacinum]